MYCFHSEHQQVEGVQSAHGGSLRCEGIGQIQNWSVILKEENLGFRLNINLSAILKNLSNYAQVYIHICLYLHCIVLFPLRAPASWWSAKCTRRLFKVRRNWPNSKLICYSERGEPMLSFEYELSGHPWKLFKVWTNLQNSKLICYSERREPRLSFEYKFVGHFWKLLKLYPKCTFILIVFSKLYCIVSTESTSKLNMCKVHTEAL